MILGGFGANSKSKTYGGDARRLRELLRSDLRRIRPGLTDVGLACRPQPHAASPAIFGDEFDASCFERSSDRSQVIAMRLSGSPLEIDHGRSGYVSGLCQLVLAPA